MCGSPSAAEAHARRVAMDAPLAGREPGVGCGQVSVFCEGCCRSPAHRVAVWNGPAAPLDTWTPGHASDTRLHVTCALSSAWGWVSKEGPCLSSSCRRIWLDAPPSWGCGWGLTEAEEPRGGGWARRPATQPLSRGPLPQPSYLYLFGRLLGLIVPHRALPAFLVALRWPQCWWWAGVV